MSASPLDPAADIGLDFALTLTRWQQRHGRHDLPWQDTRDPYRIWVSEIMLQQTQVGAVVGYFQRFMARFPDVGSLASATEDDVLRLWSGLGYYARARNLHAAARKIVGEHKGVFPQDAKALEELPGIGRSTAAAIAAFAFGESVPILDGNVKRVLARHFGIEGFPGAKDVENRLWTLAATLMPRHASQSTVGAYTQALMDLGATVCTRHNPSCDRCPVTQSCIARKTDRTGELPAPRPRRTYPTRETTWLVLRAGNEVLLERRLSPGLWGGLWSFPEYGEKDVAGYCRSHFDCALSGQQSLPSFSHGFTHFRLEISALVCTVVQRGPRVESAGRAWMPIKEALRAAIPVPVKKVLHQL